VLRPVAKAHRKEQCLKMTCIRMRSADMPAAAKLKARASVASVLRPVAEAHHRR
jgi:hypothetical protein